MYDKHSKYQSHADDETPSKEECDAIAIQYAKYVVDQILSDPSMIYTEDKWEALYNYAAFDEFKNNLNRRSTQYTVL